MKPYDLDLHFLQRLGDIQVQQNKIVQFYLLSVFQKRFQWLTIIKMIKQIIQFQYLTH